MSSRTLERPRGPTGALQKGGGIFVGGGCGKQRSVWPAAAQDKQPGYQALRALGRQVGIIEQDVHDQLPAQSV